MLRSTDFSREMHRGEEPAVAKLLTRAYGTDHEARRVEKLRRAGVLAGEVVLPAGDRIVGYYALSTLSAPKGWLILAPVAIDPEWQGQRHGRRMIGMLAEWARLSAHYVVATGPAAFLEGAGFSRQRGADLILKDPLTQTCLAGPGTDVPEQTVMLPPAFGAP